MRDLLTTEGAKTLTGKSALAGVFGWPVEHSLSPRLHGYWLRHYGIDGAYVPLSSPPEHFAEALRALPALGFRGANVTIPHKESVLKLCDQVSVAAKRIGAVNTVVVVGGRLFGTNTDGVGFLHNLQAEAPDWRAEAAPALVLGAGGAARAIVVGLLDAGVPALHLVNRTRARAEQLAAGLEDSRVEVRDWAEAEALLPESGLVVNTTSLGLAGQPPLELDLAGLPDDAVVTDTVYKPLETPLLGRAKARGLKTVDGLGMLLHQAVPGFEAWFGHRPEVTPDLRDFVLGERAR